MAAYAPNLSAIDILSDNSAYRMMTRDGYTRRDWRFVFLSDALERAFAHILQHGYDIDHVETPPAAAQSIKDQILKWARHIQEEVPGYATWKETYMFTFDALHKPDAVPGEDTTAIGTERDLWNQYFDNSMRYQYSLEDTAAERAQLEDHAAALMIARTRLDVLTVLLNCYGLENPMPDKLALLFRKIYYTYKLREALLGHIGYYNGSLEFAAEIPEGIHRHMYILDLKLRRPDRMHLFRAPKHSICYQTDPGSQLPWNNEFTFCYGFHEFGAMQMPRFCINFIERQFVQVIRSDEDGQIWALLCNLMTWDVRNMELLAERTRIREGFIPKGQGLKPGYFLSKNSTLCDYGFQLLTLKHIVSHLVGPLTTDKIKLKDFFAHVLMLPWSDNELRIEHNPFNQLYLDRMNSADHTGQLVDYTLSNVNNSAIKDSRIAGKNEEPLLTLKNATRDPIVVGRKSHFILDPRTAANDFRWKLTLMNERQLDMLFSNIPAYPKYLSYTEKIDAVIHQGVEAASAWITSVNTNRRPVYTAPSGHMLTHARAFSNCASGCKHPDHPTLEQFRLTMIATMIGFKQHHSYEEAMFPTHGFEHNGQTLEYKDRKGYRDIIDSNDLFIRGIGKHLVAAAFVIAHEAIASFAEQAPVLNSPLPDFHPDAKAWFEMVTGKPFDPE